MKQSRRIFLKQSTSLTLGVGLLGVTACSNSDSSTSKKMSNEPIVIPTHTGVGDTFFEISLAQWSLHQSFFDNKLDNLDFAAKARNDFGIDAIEYVNAFFADKAKDQAYLKQMKQRAEDNGVKSLLIMIDREGNLGTPDDVERKLAVENHYKWVDAAKFLGCHSIRVNAFGEGTHEQVAAAAVDGLGALAEYATKLDLNVIVENHGSYSSNGQWLAGVMQQVNMKNCGTLPDFGNFCIKRSGPGFWEGDCVNEYDRYKGVQELMPFAKAVSAKTHDFNEKGEEIHTDYLKMMQIVKDANYKGYVGIEYEGKKLSEDEGIMATKKLLEKVRTQLV